MRSRHLGTAVLETIACSPVFTSSARAAADRFSNSSLSHPLDREPQSPTLGGGALSSHQHDRQRIKQLCVEERRIDGVILDYVEGFAYKHHS